jgi:hypothetical protein
LQGRNAFIHGNSRVLVIVKRKNVWFYTVTMCKWIIAVPFLIQPKYIIIYSLIKYTYYHMYTGETCIIIPAAILLIQPQQYIIIHSLTKYTYHGMYTVETCIAHHTSCNIYQCDMLMMRCSNLTSRFWIPFLHILVCRIRCM